MVKEGVGHGSPWEQQVERALTLLQVDSIPYEAKHLHLYLSQLAEMLQKQYNVEQVKDTFMVLIVRFTKHDIYVHEYINLQSYSLSRLT